MHQRLYESDHHVDQSEAAAPTSRRSRGQDRLGNAAMLDKIGLNKTDNGEDTEPDLGPAEVVHAGATPAPPPPSADPITPLPCGDELVEPIRPPAEEIEVVRPEIAPACDYTRWGPTTSGGGEDLDSGVEGMGLGEMDLESMGMEMDMGNHNSMPTSKAVESMSDEEFAAYEKVTQDLVNNTIVNMSIDEKRSTLCEMGYPGRTIDMLNETEMNQALAGSLCKTFRGMRIQGMTPEELDRLPPKEQRQFLTDLGVPAADLWRAPDRYIRKAVQDVVAVAKTPGHHTVNLKIKGGWFRGKSYDINMQVDDDGHLADVDIEKKGGLLSKIGGLIKKAMPYIAKMLAGVTGGLSLLAYGIYNAIEAARSGDWMGIIKAVGGGFLGAGFDGIAGIIDKVSSIAGTAVKGFQAIKSRNLGGIIEAFASGAETVAGFAKDQLGGFATTAREWADKARTWGGIAVTGVSALTAFKGGDALAAISSSLDTVLAIRDQTQGDQMGPPTSKSNNPGVLVTSARLFGYAETARDAAKAEPPQWGTFTANMFSMAGEYTDSGKVDTGRELSTFTQTFENGVRSGDWSKAAQAGLDISKTIDLAHRGEISDEERDKVTGRYDTAESIVIPGMEAVEKIQTGNWAGALTSGLSSAKAAELARAKPEDQERIQQKYANADRYLTPSAGCAKALADGDWSKVTSYASQLGGELTENGLVDQGARFGKLGGDIWTKIESKDWRGAGNLAKDLWGEIQNLWGDAASDAKSIEDAPSVPPGAAVAASPMAGGGINGAPRQEGPAGNPDAMKRALAWALIEAHPHGIQLNSEGEQIADYGAATTADCEAVLNEMVQIPLGGIQVVHCKNTTVTVCHDNVTVARPDMLPKPDNANEPRNHGEGSSWTNVPGAYFPAENQVVVCAQNGQISTNHGSKNLVIHEVGHAIDRTINGELDLDFLTARAIDWENLTAYEKYANGGAQESYAESMARFYNRTPDPRDERLYPNLFDYWRSIPLKPLW